MVLGDNCQRKKPSFVLCWFQSSQRPRKNSIFLVFFLVFSSCWFLFFFQEKPRKNREKTKKKTRKNRENQNLLSLEFFLVFSRFFLGFFLFFSKIFLSQMVERCWVLLDVYTNTHCHCLYLIHSQGQLYDFVSHYGCRLSME